MHTMTQKHEEFVASLKKKKKKRHFACRAHQDQHKERQEKSKDAYITVYIKGRFPQKQLLHH